MNKTHGCSRLLGYGSYLQMIRRCTQKTHKDYPRYGGSGITVHLNWINNPADFFSEIGPSPGTGYQIDRIDSRLGYIPGNVRWVTSQTNNRNRQNNRFLIFQGSVFAAAEWEERLGFPRCLITKRLNRGWTPSQALGTPTRNGSGKLAVKVDTQTPATECSYGNMLRMRSLPPTLPQHILC